MLKHVEGGRGSIPQKHTEAHRNTLRQSFQFFLLAVQKSVARFEGGGEGGGGGVRKSHSMDSLLLSKTTLNWFVNCENFTSTKHNKTNSLTFSVFW
jgi:hypothetical protein